jgi:outer membrane protein, heavy metal efflux system
MKCLIVSSLAIPLVAGCQSYKPIPLQDEAILAAWRARSPSLPLVSDFAAEQAKITDTASVFDVADGIGLAEAETIALLYNPALRSSRLLARVALVGSAEAGRWEDPRFGIDAERIISGVDDPWVVGGLVNLTIPLSGRLTAEKRLAAAEADTELLKVLDQERLVVADLRRLWAEWSAATTRTGVIEQVIADLTAICGTTARLRDAGEIDPTDARLFDIDLVRRQGQLLSARRDVARLEADLREVMGLSPAARLTLLPTLTASSSDSTVPAARHVKVRIVRAEYAVAEQALNLEVREQYPDLVLGGGFGTDQGDSRILGGVSVPLPLLNGNRRGIAEAAARRDAIRASFEQQLLATESAIARSLGEISAAKQQLNQIDLDLVPLVDRQLIDARRLLEVGEFNPLLLREAIASAADAKLELLDARLSLARAVATLAYWTELAVAAPVRRENP